MTDVRAAMKLIGGVEPTPAQMQRVQAIAHSLGIGNNDAMLPILIALDCYHGAFSTLPAKAQAAADTAAQGAADRSATLVNEAVARAVTNLGPKVGSAIVKVANDINQVDKAKWIGGVAIIVAMVFMLFGWLTHTSGYSAGYETGKAEAYKLAADEKAAAAWGNTPQGVMAHELAQAGNLSDLARCSGAGWHLDKKELVCAPQPITEDGKQVVYGWKVGKSATGTSARKVGGLTWAERLLGPRE